MKINIRGIKIDITESIKNHISNKLSKLDRYFGQPGEIEANVLVKVRNNEQTKEVTILTSKYTLRAEETHPDLYAAVDLVSDKLERQIRKNKTKLSNRYNKAPLVDFNFNYEPEEPIEEEKGTIVKRKNIDSKPMSEEEAILQMNLVNHDFFLIKNIDEDCYSVVYLRRDGDYGVINAK